MIVIMFKSLTIISHFVMLYRCKEQFLHFDPCIYPRSYPLTIKLIFLN